MNNKNDKPARSMSRLIRYLVTFIVILLLSQLGESRREKEDTGSSHKVSHSDRIIQWAEGFLNYRHPTGHVNDMTHDEPRNVHRSNSRRMTHKLRHVHGSNSRYDPGQMSDCRNLSGFWYNQHGSELLLHHNVTMGLLSGEYRTAVEVNTGFAGTKHSPVSGSFRGGQPAPAIGLLGFTVMWDGGESVASWTGQCAICDWTGQPKLVTTWTLVSAQPDCAAMWTATRVGQDVFTRHEQKSGPRKWSAIDVPIRSIPTTTTESRGIIFG